MDNGIRAVLAFLTKGSNADVTGMEAFLDEIFL